MNFFGHAVVASRISADPEFVLGSMMPDFEGMVAETANRFTAATLVRGIHTHYATDHVFHTGERFLTHQAKARAELREAQLRTGPRRAVAHVGVELLLDAALAAVVHRTALYKAALDAGRRSGTLAGASFLVHAKLSALFTSLRARAAYVVPNTPEETALRLERIFAHRPSLALQPEELPVVVQWAQRAWTPIAIEAEVWLAELVEAVNERLNDASTQSSVGSLPSLTAHDSMCPSMPKASSYEQH